MFALMHGIDQGQLTLIQHIFLGNNIYDLDNIDKLPVKGATVYVMPMKIKGGSGGPTRIVAHTDLAARSSRQTTRIHFSGKYFALI